MHVQSCPVLLRVLTTNGERCTGVCEKGGAVGSFFFVASEGLGAIFTNSSLLAQYRLVLVHVTDFKELGPVNFTSGGFGAVFVSLLFAQYLPVRLHLPATNGEHCTGDVVSSLPG